MSSFVNLSPLAAAVRRWRPARGAPAVTVVCKASFDLRPGQLQLAEVQKEILECDQKRGDDLSASVYAPADVCPFKQGVDVLLVGEAFSSESTRSIRTRLTVGEVDKTIEVFCDRHFDQQGKLQFGAGITKMDLSYERAAEGGKRTNVFGVSANAAPDRYGRRFLPNLQPAGLHIESSSEQISPAGYGPLLSRVGGGLDQSWRHKRLPDDTSPGVFNVAPLDQRLRSLDPNQEIVLEGLHPEHARLDCCLPGFEPRCFVVVSGDAREVTLRADTLWFDTSQSLCTVTWRGQLEFSSRAEDERVFLAMHTPDAPVTWLDIQRRVEEGIQEEHTIDLVSGESGATLKPDELTEVGQLESTSAPLPFAPSASGKRPPREGADVLRRAALGRRRTGAFSTLPARTGDRSPSWLQGGGAQEQHGDAVADKPVSSQPAVSGVKGDSSASPWIQGAKNQQPALGGMTPSSGGLGSLGALPSAGVSSPSGAMKKQEPPARADLPKAVHEEVKKPSGGGELAKAPRSGSSEMKANSREVVQLLSFNTEMVDKAIAKDPWREFLSQQESREDDEPIDFDAEPPPPPDPETVRRDKMAIILSRGPLVTTGELRANLRESVDANGCFEPSTVMMGGRLVLPFDATERLKALVTCVTPLVGDDDALRDVLSAVGELLQTPWLERGEEIAMRMAGRVRTAYSKRERLIDVEQLDELTERMLLEQRKFQHRNIFAENVIRGFLSSGDEKEAVPVYIPEEISAELPMFASFRARVFAEIHVRQDQYEKHPCAIRVIGLGRVVEVERAV